MMIGQTAWAALVAHGFAPPDRAKMELPYGSRLADPLILAICGGQIAALALGLRFGGGPKRKGR